MKSSLEILPETRLKFSEFSEKSFKNKDGIEESYLVPASCNIFQVMSFMWYICVATL